jgi:hypothetical protein
VTRRIPVVAELAGYRVAVAGLPLSAQAADEAAGAIVVVDGAARWWDAAARAIDAGAAAIVVAEPHDVPLDAVAALAGLAAEVGVPVVVHRARLREDLVALAVAHREGVRPRVVVAECRASAGDLVATIRDAVGWMRALAGTDLVVASASHSADGGTALLRSSADDRVVGSMLSAVTRPEGSLLRVQALGETTTEFELDEPIGRCALATSTVRGRLVAPAVFETGERASLRRAIDALAEQRMPGELPALLHDAHAASAIAPARI